MTIQQQQHEAWKARALRLGIIQPQKPVYIPDPERAAVIATEARRRKTIERLQREAVPAAARRKRDAQVVARARKLFLSPVEQVRPTLRSIAEEVAEKHNVTIDEMQSPRRQKRIVRARHEYCYRARHETTHSYPRIGAFLGGRDHSTVIHGVKKWGELLERGDV